MGPHGNMTFKPPHYLINFKPHLFFFFTIITPYSSTQRAKMPLPTHAMQPTQKLKRAFHFNHI